MDIHSTIVNKKTSNEDDFSFSISNEHNEQEMTSIGETGKSYGILSLMNLPRPIFSITNKNKLFNINKIDSNYNKDNFSTYTSMKKIRNDDSKLNYEMNTEVRKFF